MPHNVPGKDANNYKDGRTLGGKSFRLTWTPELRQQVKDAATIAGVSMTEWILAAIREKLAGLKPPKDETK